MGLDMYLTAEKYNAGGYDYVRKSESEHYKAEAAEFDKILSALELDTNDFVSAETLAISLRVGYWRKANAIHSWFVQNVQDGKDDCAEYYVSRDALNTLQSICKQIMDTVNLGEPETEKDMFDVEYKTYPNMTLDTDKAQELLNPQSGFFFGSTNFDYWYYRDLELTDKIIESLKKSKLWEDLEYSFNYQSSW